MRPRATVLAQSRKKLRQLSRTGIAAPATCLFCTFSAPPKTTRRLKACHATAAITSRDGKLTRRYATEAVAGSERRDLHDLLVRLKSEFPEVVNAAQVELALQSLRQEAGREKVRVAVLGIDKGQQTEGQAQSKESARALLRALLADPLSDGQPWEAVVTRRLDGASGPLLVKVRPQVEDFGVLKMQREALVREIEVSAPGLDAAELEVVVMDLPLTDPAAPGSGMDADLLLVPAVASDPVASSELDLPVHKAILVGNTFGDAVKLSSVAGQDSQVVKVALDSRELNRASGALDGSSLQVVDVQMANDAIDRFRQGAQHGIEYEKLWHASHIRALDSFFKAGIRATPGTTKQAVYDHISHILRAAHIRLQIEKSAQAAALQDVKRQGGDGLVEAQNVEVWAQNAHAELQEQLDQAFSGRRWRQLGWWKLFWRVDDVELLMGEMVRERFLPTAEKELVYLTGRIAATRPAGAQTVFSQPSSGAPDARRATTRAASPMPQGLPKWPGHIAFTRRYLLDESIPALQALAQKLVLQAGATSALTTALAALMYVSSYGLSEAGAVASLGAVYALGRMQQKWDTGRKFWEGEVREEGRKAVRGVESSLAGVLNSGAEASAARTRNEKASEVLMRAQKKLESLKA